MDRYDPVFDHYSPQTLGHIANGFDTMQRWLFKPEYTLAQRAAIADMEALLLVPQAINNIVSGEMTPETAAAWLQTRSRPLQRRGSWNRAGLIAEGHKEISCSWCPYVDWDFSHELDTDRTNNYTFR